MDFEDKKLKKMAGAAASVLLIAIWLFLPIYVQDRYGIAFFETAFVIIVVYYAVYQVIRRTDLFSP